LGHSAITGVTTSYGYIRWLYTISHPHLIASEEDVHIPRPAEQEALDEIATEQEGEHGYLELTGRLGCNRDHVLSIMDSGVVERRAAEWASFESILAEVHGGWIYHGSYMML